MPGTPLASLMQSLTERSFAPNSKGMVYYQKVMDGNQKLYDLLKEYFRVPENFDDWPFAMQLKKDDEGLNISRQDFSGKILAEQTLKFSLKPRSTEAILELPSSLSQPCCISNELVVAKRQQQRALWFFDRDKDLEYPEADFTAKLKHHQLTLTAKTLLRDVCIFVDRLHPEASISDQLITILPGESFTFEIKGLECVRLEQLISHPVFQCVNNLIKKGRQ